MTSFRNISEVTIKIGVGISLTALHCAPIVPNNVMVRSSSEKIVNGKNLSLKFFLIMHATSPKSIKDNKKKESPKKKKNVQKFKGGYGRFTLVIKSLILLGMLNRIGSEAIIMPGIL